MNSVIANKNFTQILMRLSEIYFDKKDEVISTIIRIKEVFITCMKTSTRV
jgi:hypothetical protein